jgi:hypothetical protein
MDDFSNITILTVNYNSTELTTRLINTISFFYPDPSLKIHVVDGSDNEMYINQMKSLCSNPRYDDRITLHTLSYNIHHGTGMMYGLHQIDTDYVLILDNDVYLTNGGVIELVIDKTIQLSSIRTESFLFLGCQMLVDENGKAVVNNVRNAHDHNIEKIIPSTLIRNNVNVVDPRKLIKYIHPSFLLVNRKLFLDYVENGTLRPFIKHGAPCLTTMYDIKQHGMENMLIDMTDVLTDYYIHDWNGVVKSSGGYHLSTQHHFGNVTSSYANIPRRLDEYLIEQKTHDDVIEKEDEQVKAKQIIETRGKRFAHMKDSGNSKRKLNSKQLKKLTN